MTPQIEALSETDIKIKILKRTIKEDQDAVAEQWLKTFKHNAKDNAATAIAKLMVASVAKGDFKTKSSLISSELTNPPDTLSVVDYVSHASRIIIDYEGLNETNKEEFLAYFPNANEKGVFSRSATHAVDKKDGKIVELKGFMLGLAGQLPRLVKTPYDFGLDIAMGGQDQTNYIGRTISANGFSGTLYFHHYFPKQLLMLGLEQSAPAASFFDLFWGHKRDNPSVQQDYDQFGQGHSLTGASDTYTAAGSLYFSDPVYQAKLLLGEKPSAPPDKYGAMQVTLTDDNWQHIKKFIDDLNTNLEENKDDLVTQKLSALPQTATETPQIIQSYIALDFKVYLKRIALLLEQVVPEKDKIALKQELNGLNIVLLSHIEALQRGDNSVYQKLQDQINTICKLKNLPQEYIEAIDRIKRLFQLQFDNKLELKETPINILKEQRCSQLLDVIAGLEEKSNLLREFFSLENISQDNGVGEFLTSLNRHSDRMNEIKNHLLKDQKAESIDENGDHTEQECIDLEPRITEKNSLETSWYQVFSPPSLSLNDLDLYQEKIQGVEQFMEVTPRLVSENSLLEAKKIIEQQKHALEEQQKKLNELQLGSNDQDIKAGSKKLSLSREELNTQLRKALDTITQQKEDLEVQELEHESLQGSNTILRLQINSTSNLPDKDRERLLEEIASQLKIKNEQLDKCNEFHLNFILEMNTKIFKLQEECEQYKKQNHILNQQCSQINKLSNQSQNDQQNNRELREQLLLKEKQHQEMVEGLQKKIMGLEASRPPNLTPAMKQASSDLAPVFIQLKKVEQQAESLKKRGYISEGNEAKTLALLIRKEINKYLDDVDKPKHDKALGLLKESTRDRINNVSSELKAHRGWKRILGNLAACILGLGAGYVLAGFVHKRKTGDFLFFNETRTMEILNGLQESVDKLEPGTVKS